MFREDYDREGLEVVLELPRDDEENEHQFFQPLVFGLWSIHGMSDVVDRLLDAFIFTNRAPLTADSETTK